MYDYGGKKEHTLYGGLIAIGVTRIIAWALQLICTCLLWYGDETKRFTTNSTAVVPDPRISNEHGLIGRGWPLMRLGILAIGVGFGYGFLKKGVSIYDPFFNTAFVFFNYLTFTYEDLSFLSKKILSPAL